MKKLKTKQYDVFVGNDSLQKFNFSKLNASQFVIITDKNVDQLLSKTLTGVIKSTKVPISKIVIPTNESSKTLSMSEKVLRQLASQNIDREAVILALGGGIVGDLSGFVASIYKRGVRFVQIPTTLLAQVDSSIGAKNGINLPEGKNLVGTNYPPIAVVTDTSLLSTLPKREIAEGMAEIIKYGVIWDKKLFKYIENNISKPTDKFYQKLVMTGIKDKIKISDKDPHEHGVRKVINYGHTIGHALEAASNHKISHGEGVALGMQAEAYISNSLGIMKKFEMERQNDVLSKLGVKPKLIATDEQLISIMRRDKKSKAGKLYFVLPAGIGSVHRSGKEYAFEASEALTKKSLAYLRSRLEQS